MSALDDVKEMLRPVSLEFYIEVCQAHLFDKKPGISDLKEWGDLIKHDIPATNISEERANKPSLGYAHFRVDSFGLLHLLNFIPDTSD